jgi:Transmembrane amino acid transporter protein
VIKLVLAFGTIMFAFAGAATFPTIQADMRDRRQFPKSALLAVSSKYQLSFTKTNMRDRRQFTISALLAVSSKNCTY